MVGESPGLSLITEKSNITEISNPSDGIFLDTMRNTRSHACMHAIEAVDKPPKSTHQAQWKLTLLLFIGR